MHSRICLYISGLNRSKSTRIENSHSIFFDEFFIPHILYTLIDAFDAYLQAATVEKQNLSRTLHYIYTNQLEKKSVGKAIIT